MNSSSDKVCKDFKDKMTSQQRSLTPAVLGITPVSHGAKLPPNMNSQEKSNFFTKLEAFRQARRDKLVATVLARGKQACNSKPSTNLVKPKLKPKSNSASGTESNQGNCDGSKTVFDRLYENAGKQTVTKPSKENKQDKLNNIKRPQNGKFLCYQSQDKRSKVPKINAITETSKPLSNSDPSSEEVIFAESILEDETKVLSADSQCLEIKSEEVEMVNEGALQEQQVPLLAAANKGAQDPSTEENEKLVTSSDVGIFKEKKESNEKCHQQLKFRNVYMPEKDLGLKKAKVFKNGKKMNTEVIQKAPLRRSISLIFRKKIGNYESAIHRTQSECNLEKLITDKKDDISKENMKEDFNRRFNKNENGANSIKATKSVCFLTPKPNPLSAFHLRSKLENWLFENGHSIETYKHLRCFGLATEEAKCTPYRRQQKIDDSVNTSFYSTAPNTPMADIIDESDKENVTPPPPYPKVEKAVDSKDVEGWLSDLHQLIVHVKYPGDRCEEWLNAISKKFPGCAQLPMYWECLAAMNSNPSGDGFDKEKEENKNFQNDEVEDSLAELLDKLVLDENCKSASKIERGLSVKNIFKSKTVKFALKEKAIKQLDPAQGKEAKQKVLVATPVRRSARIQTQNKTNVIMSLKSLDPEQRRSLSFKPNEALFAG